MLAFFGRERELQNLLQALHGARDIPVARAVQIEGPSGIGKSTLLSTLLEQLGAEWLSVSTAGHRIQSGLPFAVIRRLVSQLTKDLGAESGRYGATLTALSDSPGAMLAALLEGVTLDRPVALVIDDAQWADDESVDALRDMIHSLADRPLGVILTVRTSDDTTMPRVAIDQTVVLEPLTPRDARRLAQHIYPLASESVISAIASQADGKPIDVVALAEAAQENNAGNERDVAASMRAVVAKRVQTSAAAFREFLQIASLLPEPIDYTLLRRLWPEDETLLELISSASARYLVQDGSQLRFRHALIGEAILETIPVKIPLRRRIIAALSADRVPSLEDRLHIIDQALACGDRKLAHATLLQLALEASERGFTRMTISAASRALEIGEPNDETFVQFYSAFASALQFTMQHHLAEEALHRALYEVERRKLDGAGNLASQLILAQWLDDQHAKAQHTYEHYAHELTDPVDLAQLHSAALWFAICDSDAVRAGEIANHLYGLEIQLPANVSIRIESARAYVALRVGNHDSIPATLDRIELLTRREQSSLQDLGEVVRLFVNFNLLGANTNHFETYRNRNGEASVPFINFMIGLTHLYSGRYDSASITVKSALATTATPAEHRRLLSIATAIGVMSEEIPDLIQSIETNIGKLLQLKEHEPMLLAIATWYIALPDRETSRVSALTHLLLNAIGKPTDPTVFVPLAPICFAAARAQDREILSRIADEKTTSNDRTPIIAVERELARATARAVLQEPGAHQHLEAARRQARDLGLVTFVELSQRTLSITQGVAEKKKSPLSQRERQVAELIGQGATNREIAEVLVLSERTVEGHVANMFNKLGVSSRTKLAGWVLQSKAAPS